MYGVLAFTDGLPLKFAGHIQHPAPSVLAPRIRWRPPHATAFGTGPRQEVRDRGWDRLAFLLEQ